MYNAFVSWYQKMPIDYCQNFRSRKHRFPLIPHSNNNREKILTDFEKEHNWTQSKGLNAKALREVHVLVEDILRRLQDAGYHVGEKIALIDRRADLRKHQEKDVTWHQVLLKVSAKIKENFQQPEKIKVSD